MVESYPSNNRIRRDRLEIVKEGLRHTEMHLHDHTQIVAHADQRALALATAGAAIAAFLISFSAETPSPTINLVGAIISILGACLAAFSARPREFHGPGHQWNCWEGHYEENDYLVSVLKSQASENDKRISDNLDMLKKRGLEFRAALIVTLFSVAFVAMAQLAVSACFGDATTDSITAFHSEKLLFWSLGNTQLQFSNIHVD